jgi:hypothetical protein
MVLAMAVIILTITTSPSPSNSRSKSTAPMALEQPTYRPQHWKFVLKVQ